jgi:hypothetical protein
MFGLLEVGSRSHKLRVLEDGPSGGQLVSSHTLPWGVARRFCAWQDRPTTDPCKEIAGRVREAQAIMTGPPLQARLFPRNVAVSRAPRAREDQ